MPRLLGEDRQARETTDLSGVGSNETTPRLLGMEMNLALPTQTGPHQAVTLNARTVWQVGKESDQRLHFPLRAVRCATACYCG